MVIYMIIYMYNRFSVSKKDIVSVGYASTLG